MSKEYRLIKEYPGSPKKGVTTTFKKGRYYEDNKSHRKELVENNPEYWEKVEEKNYEILSYYGGEVGHAIYKLTNCKQGFTPYHSKLDVVHDKFSVDYMLGNNTWFIHSVKRSKDGVVFTVGDLFKVVSGCTYKIQGFKLKDGEIFVEYLFPDAYYFTLNQIEHHIKPLFTTKDGVDIFKGDKTCWINNWTVTNLVDWKRTGNTSEIHFSTKAKAEEYILMNKPCISINDILNFCGSTQSDIIKTISLEGLQQLVKSKL